MQKISNDTIIILAGSVFLLIITLFIVWILLAYKKRDYRYIREKKKLQEDFTNQLLQSQIEVQEQTFQQIGKELHDNVAQLLSTSRMLIGLTERSLESPPDTLLTANNTLGQAITEVRSLSKSLDKEWLEQFNFIENLKTEIDRINAGKGIKADLIIRDQIRLPFGKRIMLFRIVQEAIQNAIKHGNATLLNIFIAKDNNNLSINIADNGVGFDINQHVKGMGLANMQHRTRLLNGSIKYSSGQGKGTTISIIVPENDEQ